MSLTSLTLYNIENANKSQLKITKWNQDPDVDMAVV